MEIDMAKSKLEIGDLDEYLRHLGAEALKEKLKNKLVEFESDTYDEDDKERDDDEDTEESEDTTLGDIRSEVYQMSQHIQMFTGIATEGKAEIGDIRRRLEEMRLKLDLIQKNVLDTTKELKEQFTGFDGLVFANQQLQEGMKELKETNKVITAGVDAIVAEVLAVLTPRTKYVHMTEERLKDSEKAVKELKSDNSHLKSQTKQLRKANHELRTEINQLEKKLFALTDFNFVAKEPAITLTTQESDITRQIKQVIDEVQDD